ncbi:MAG: nucleoside triphosphate pyrophosphohydrolase [Gemmatimonadales bacterium]
MQEKSALGRALDVVRDLRRRCPWDRAQTRETLRPYLVEEVLELDAALREGDQARIRDEMGDFLLHLAWQFVIAGENGEFTPEEVAADLASKMRRRHPHLYDLGPPEAWEQLKRREGRDGIFDGLPDTLPPLLMAHRLQQRAASLGFDWPDAAGPLEKVREELAEVEHELAQASGSPAQTDPSGPARPSDGLIDEIGDLLFAVVNLARKLEVQPGLALERANRKFRNRFHSIERLAGERGLEVETAGLEKLDELWNEVKAGELGP